MEAKEKITRDLLQSRDPADLTPEELGYAILGALLDIRNVLAFWAGGKAYTPKDQRSDSSRGRE